MSIISINDSYRITSDSRQWIVQRRTWNDEKGQWSEWNSIIFHGRLGSLVNELHDRMLRETTVEGLAALSAENERISKELSAALAPHLTININTIRG